MNWESRLLDAYFRGRRVLKDNSLPCVNLRAVRSVEAHRWYWRPKRIRLLLIAESHVFTSSEDVNRTIDTSLLPASVRSIPKELVRLVYCLGYGENQLLRTPAAVNSGTWQFWDIFGRLAGLGSQPRRGESDLRERIDWKIRALRRLQMVGIWLIDSSVHAIYLPGGKRNDVCADALHRDWWQCYGSWVVKTYEPSRVWAIGKDVHRVLTTETGLAIDGWIYQPNCRGISHEQREERFAQLMTGVKSLGRFSTSLAPPLRARQKPARWTKIPRGKPVRTRAGNPVDVEPAYIKEKVILINIGREWRPDLSADDLYERTRRWWVVNPDAHSAVYGMAIAEGIIREVYRIAEWSRHDLRKMRGRSPARKLDETTTLPKQHLRWQFSGLVATEMRRYIGKGVAHYRRRGAQNPVLYVNC